ncbi:hypothetical protein BD410DRAFT_806815 [Rickenella mellea]|uniref:Uncharacterized protein n=1 Tax=Rickenella mellea TaxID=50990 RepID=A0A4Y7PSW2_9AGAM|nr:hypothetical protein BD410DRAFT_806815 [Rickenella mellea]
MATRGNPYRLNSLRTHAQRAGMQSPTGTNGAPLNDVAASEEYIDPRPPWMFSASALLRALLVPAGLIYGVFVHDFGEGEHVFTPPRRWWARQKSAFFTLSPEERTLVESSVERPGPDELSERGGTGEPSRV